MAAVDTKEFEADARKMVDELAVKDPAKLKELHAASLEMKKMMEKDPEMFKETFGQYMEQLSKGEVPGPDIFGRGSPTPAPSSQPSAPAPKASAPASKPAKSPQPSKPIPPPPPPDPKIDKSLDPKAPLHPHPGPTAAERKETTLGDGYQYDDELWYAPNQKQKRPENLLARWAISCHKTKKKENEEVGPPVYINVCESDTICPYEQHTGAIPCYTSELVRNHVDIVLHTEALARALFEPALKEDIINLCLHKVSYFHKLLVQDYTLQGPLLSVIMGEVAPPRSKAKASSHIEDVPTRRVQEPLPPMVVSNVEIEETDVTLDIHATLPTDSAKGVDLTLIGRNSLRLLVPNALPKDIALPCDVIEDDYTCKFSKKKKTLRITLQKSLERALD